MPAGGPPVDYLTCVPPNVVEGCPVNRRKARKIEGWLVTWEWIGDHAKRDDKVAAILNPRFSAERVRELVELLYLTQNSTLSERMNWARDKHLNPYPAQFHTLDGVPWQGQIHCGHNPFLFARLVDDLAVERDAEGNERATWRERPKPDIVRRLAHPSAPPKLRS